MLWTVGAVEGAQEVYSRYKRQTTKQHTEAKWRNWGKNDMHKACKVTGWDRYTWAKEVREVWPCPGESLGKYVVIVVDGVDLQLNSLHVGAFSPLLKQTSWGEMSGGHNVCYCEPPGGTSLLVKKPQLLKRKLFYTFIYSSIFIHLWQESTVTHTILIRNSGNMDSEGIDW